MSDLEHDYLAPSEKNISEELLYAYGMASEGDRLKMELNQRLDKFSKEERQAVINQMGVIADNIGAKNITKIIDEGIDIDDKCLAEIRKTERGERYGFSVLQPSEIKDIDDFLPKISDQEYEPVNFWIHKRKISEQCLRLRSPRIKLQVEKVK